jgi:beta-lactam-binding protein with PASTA domain
MENKDIKDSIKKLWANYVVRNIVLFVSLLILVTLFASLMLNLFTRHNSYKDVPDFAGYTMGEAREMAKKDNLRLEINDSLYVSGMEPGVILEQRPLAGTQVKSGRRIFVTVNSSSQKMVDVPYVVDYTLRQAKNILEAAGLNVGKLVYVNDMATNSVLRQSVGGREVSKGKTVQAEYGSDITLTVGRAYNAERVAIPRVVGMTLRDARSRLIELGINVGNPVNDNTINESNQSLARVYRQSPAPNGYASLGSTATLYLSLDSTAVSKGVASSDIAVQTVSRERFVLDSLSREGYSGEQLHSEADWIIKMENGTVSPEDIERHFQTVIDEASSNIESLESIEGESTDETTSDEEEFFF